MLSPPLAISNDHILTHFDCGQPALNEWLKLRALKNESRFSRTFVVGDGMTVVGYYCISAGSIERQSSPSKLRRKAPDAIPISIIGRLAVSKSHAGQGLGASLLADAFRRIAHASKSIAIAAVMVQAKDDAARQFYQACAEFIEYPDNSRTLFLPIATILDSLEN
jgi:GNAT superfamily N-acetyltransferase